MGEAAHGENWDCKAHQKSDAVVIGCHRSKQELLHFTEKKGASSTIEAHLQLKD